MDRGILPGVTTGKYDAAVTAILVTQERMKTLDFCRPVVESVDYLSIPAIPISRSRRSRSPIPIDPDQSGVGCVRAPLDAFPDLSVAFRCQVRREPVPVVNRRDPRATRSAPMRRVAACAGGAC
jgi:Bacterial extracellular solute-binding proteins, family 3